jgi:hypothetical protein
MNKLISSVCFCWVASLALVCVAWAQPPVAPSPMPAGLPDEERVGNYNVVNNFEVGYRFHTVGGSVDQYRSTVNYGNGIRLLSGSMLVNTKDGHGNLFDHVSLTMLGLGNDPYESSNLRIERNGTYRYEVSWRRNDYYNPGLVSNGGVSFHLTDTSYGMQDHNFTLFPQSKFKFFLGYTGSAQLGPAYTTERDPNAVLTATGGRVIELLDVRRRWNEYRVGSEFQVAGIRVNWMRGWEDFQEDNTFNRAPAGVPGYPATANPTLVALNKADPDHGTNPYWRVGLFQDIGKWFTWNGRFTYTSGRRAFALDEAYLAAAGNATITSHLINTGNAQRPVATGNLNLVFTPAAKLNFTNSTALYNARTQGDDIYALVTPAAPAHLVTYNYLGVRTLSNDTTVNYQWLKMVGLFAGYHYSDRFIKSTELFDTLLIPAQQTDILHATNFGVRVRPVQALTIQLSAEVGRSNRPFTPVDPRNYTALNGRVQYRRRNFQMLATTNTDYNNNSVVLSSYSSHSRRYGLDGSWTPRSWFSLDAGYSKMHLDTAGGIAYRIAPGTLITGEQSLYFSNIHTLSSGIRFTLKDRVEVYAGLTRVQDTGDGRATAAGAGIGSPRSIFEVVQTFPLTFLSPMGRVSLKLNNRLRWNAGYQYYGYRQEFNLNPNLNYLANTGYTSLSFAF